MRKNFLTDRAMKKYFISIFVFIFIVSSSAAFAQEEKILSSDIMIQKLQNVKKKKEKINLLIELADAYRIESVLDKALSTCKETLALELDRRQEQKIYRILGDTYSAKKEYSDAIINYREAISLAPEHIGVRLSLAETYELSDLYELAIEEYLKILEIDPKAFEANFNLGNLYLKEGFPDKAVRYFRMAVIVKMDADAYRMLALCYEEIGDTDLAISMEKSAIAIGAKYGDYIDLGRLYSTEKKYKEAEETFLKAEDIDKNTLDAYLYLGILYLDKNEISKARTIFLMSSKKFPESALIHFFLGNIYYRQGERNLSRNEMRQSANFAKSETLKTFSQKYLEFINKTLK